MHEYAITESLVKLVLEESERVKADKIKTINLVVGEISTIIPDCIEMYFEVLAKGTMLEDAVLKFKLINAELKCSSCGKEFPKDINHMECPECGEIGVFTEKGKEFYIESIEIE